MTLPAHATEEERYLFEERAAIHQFDGGATKENAEKMAYREIFGC